MKTYIILTFSISTNALANILMKMGMLRSGEDESLIVRGMKLAINPYIILGILSFVAALLGYLYVLSKINLSIAYPLMTSLGFFIVIGFSWLFLKETITYIQFVGFILILGGVWLVAH